MLLCPHSLISDSPVRVSLWQILITANGARAAALCCCILCVCGCASLIAIPLRPDRAESSCIISGPPGGSAKWIETGSAWHKATGRLSIPPPFAPQPVKHPSKTKVLGPLYLGCVSAGRWLTRETCKRLRCLFAQRVVCYEQLYASSKGLFTKIQIIWFNFVHHGTQNWIYSNEVLETKMTGAVEWNLKYLRCRFVRHWLIVIDAKIMMDVDAS